MVGVLAGDDQVATEAGSGLLGNETQVSRLVWESGEVTWWSGGEWQEWKVP